MCAFGWLCVVFRFAGFVCSFVRLFLCRVGEAFFLIILVVFFSQLPAVLPWAVGGVPEPRLPAQDGCKFNTSKGGPKELSEPPKTSTLGDEKVLTKFSALVF